MRKKFALVATLIIAIGLAGWGIYLVNNPPVMMFGRMPQSPRFPYLGQVLLGVGIMILLFCKIVARGVAWFAAKFRHWVLLFIALVLHPLMHLIGLPHQEEWIVALLSGGITLSALEHQLLLWWHRLRQRFKRNNA